MPFGRLLIFNAGSIKIWSGIQFFQEMYTARSTVSQNAQRKGQMVGSEHKAAFFVTQESSSAGAANLVKQRCAMSYYLVRQVVLA